MIIFCEKTYAEQRLQKGFSKIMSFRDLSILARYFKYIGKNKIQIRESLVIFCKKFNPDYNEVLFEKIIHNAVLSTTKYKLKIFEPIFITKGEVEAIRTVSDYRYQKILFVMLAISKYFSHPNNKEYYVNIPFTEVLKHARVSARKQERNDIMLELNTSGLIEITLNGTFKINFVNEEQNDQYITIEDSSNLVSYLPFPCSICGKEVVMKSKSRKMCEECWKEREREIKRDWWNKSH